MNTIVKMVLWLGVVNCRDKIDKESKIRDQSRFSWWSEDTKLTKLRKLQRNTEVNLEFKFNFWFWPQQLSILESIQTSPPLSPSNF